MEIKPHEIQVTYGPSLYTPFKSLIVNFDRSIFGSDLSLSAAEQKKLFLVLPKPLSAAINIANIESCDRLLIHMIKTLLDLKEPMDLSIDILQIDTQNYQLQVEYYNETTARHALNTSLLAISFLKSSMAEPPLDTLKQIEYMLRNLLLQLPGVVAMGMLASSRNRAIPTFLIDDSAFITSFGQGNKSMLFELASSQFDSLIGYKLQKDKILTNSYFRKIGYPTSRQKIAQTLEMSIEIAEELGYPVVVKPHRQGQGKGVTANIKTADQLKNAYEEAAKFSPNNVLVEKHIDGDVYRITMSKGEIIGLGCRFCAQVTADGINTVRKLIDLENIRRKEPHIAALKIKQIALDNRLQRNLDNAGLHLDSVPVVGSTVLLGDIVNRSVGGSLTMLDLDEMHSDYHEMCKDISRIFRLDSIGIDVISADISRSWREVGVIIEINSYPMAAPDLADKIIENYFSDGTGRVPTTLIVTDDKNFSLNFFEEKQNSFQNIGYADKVCATFKSGKLIAEDEGLHNRCLSLLLNTQCDAIVVAMTPDEIIEDGLPIDRFDLCVIDLKGSYESDKITQAVKKLSAYENLEQWLVNYVSCIETR